MSLYMYVALQSVMKYRMRLAGHIIRKGRKLDRFKHFKGKSTGKRTVRKPRRRGKGNIRVDLKQSGVNTRNWTDLAQEMGFYFWRTL